MPYFLDVIKIKGGNGVRNIKKISFILFACFFWSIGGRTVFATYILEKDESSLIVDYEYNGTVYPDVEVEIFQVAKWENSGFVLTDPFSSCGITFELADQPSVSTWLQYAKTLETYVQEKGCTCTQCKETNNNGFCEFENLDNGIYYVEFPDVVCKDGTLTSNPMIISLPIYKETTDTWEYEVEIDLKVAWIADPIIPKKPDEPETPNDPDEPDKPDTPDEQDKPDEQEPMGIPQTGSLRWLVNPLAGVGLLLFLLGILVNVKKGRDEDA